MHVPALHCELLVQGSPMALGTPPSPDGAVQTDSATPVMLWHVAPVNEEQSVSVVQPGTHTSSPALF
jgi:hypothetical protein